MTGLTFLTAVLAIAVSALGGRWLVPVVLRAADRSEPADRSDDAARSAATDGGRAVLRGGTWIGILERVAVTGSVLAGFPAGVAVVVAVKGLGRYPELRENPAASERFVIGTLASLVWAGMMAWIAIWVFGRI
jgi:hypothetical protein